MKIIIVSLFTVLTFSCNHNDSHLRSPKNTLSKHDEIRRIIVDDWIREFESRNHLTVGQKDALDKMKKEKHNYLRGYEIRGPLTIEQVEQGSLERIKQFSRKDIPLVPFGFDNEEWNELKSEYSKGTEIYYIKSDERS
jgi:hypothetical protein